MDTLTEDVRLKEMERAIVSGDQSLIPAYVAFLRRLGRKPKVDTSRLVYKRLRLRVELFVSPLCFKVVYKKMGCLHQHLTFTQANKCAKRKAYGLILKDEELMKRFVKV